MQREQPAAAVITQRVDTAGEKPTLPFGGRKVVWPPPAYANGQIFARNGKELVCASLTAKP